MHCYVFFAHVTYSWIMNTSSSTVTPDNYLATAIGYIMIVLFKEAKKQ